MVSVLAFSKTLLSSFQPVNVFETLNYLIWYFWLKSTCLLLYHENIWRKISSYFSRLDFYWIVLSIKIKTNKLRIVFQLNRSLKSLSVLNYLQVFIVTAGCKLKSLFVLSPKNVNPTKNLFSILSNTNDDFKQSNL